MHDRGVYHFANGDYLEGVWQEAALITCLGCAWQYLKLGQGRYHGAAYFHGADGSVSRRVFLAKFWKPLADSLLRHFETRCKPILGKKGTHVSYIICHMPIYGFLKVDWNQNASKDYTEYTALQCLILIVRPQVYENGVLLKCQDYTFFCSLQNPTSYPLYTCASVNMFPPSACSILQQKYRQIFRDLKLCHGGKQFKTAPQPKGLFSRVAEVQQGNESRSYAKVTHRQIFKMMQDDASVSNFREMKCGCFAEAYCSLGISQTCTRLMEERLTVFHCSWGRNLLLNAPNPLLWNQVREHIMNYLGETKRVTSACRLLITTKTSELRTLDGTLF